ncbi:ArsA family ATPase [Williamsia deligens]|uniref:ArsA family ATPase n=1 Tax=Williamsia deligens TaxID=321325 RepID=A0ABW3G9D6_9NOCA|nr:ArsA-related P-loop ATPase [Williamsia deligens]MCP2195839.1 arsenite-transporting ATPase [Williamsia deligens]
MLGPGGAGVTTVAAAFAVGEGSSRRARTADAGDTLLVTLDRFRQASRVFGVYSAPGQAVAVSQQTHLLELDTLAMLGETWAVLRGPMSLVGGAVADVATIDPDELGGMPGIEQLLAWRRIRDEAVSGRWRRVVVDCSGGIDPLGFLGVPGLVAGYLEQIWPRHRRLAGAAETPRLAGGAGIVDGLAADCSDIAGLLSDPTVTRAHVVTPAGSHGRESAHRFLAALDLMGVCTTEVVVNRGRDDGQDPVPTGRAGSLRCVETQELSVEPRTVAALRKLDVRLDDEPGVVVGSAAAQVEHVSGTGLSSVYRLSWPQLLPDPETLALGRSGDDLLVTLSGVRHRVTLPSVLRRCTVLDARWDDGTLSVRFSPDPAVWPRAGHTDD